jgi:hypothetical protein
MARMISREEFEAIVRDGLVSDIFRAERAIALLRVSGGRANQINSGNGNFGELFGAFQTALQTEATLAIARLYDRPSPRHPTRCLVGVLDFIASHSEELPEIREPYQLGLLLSSMGVTEKLLNAVGTGGAEFAIAFAGFGREQLSVAERKESIARLKALRDKSLAHNEHVAAIDAPTWAALFDLIDLAKHIVGVLGWAYFNTAYTINGEYILSEDAERPSRALNRLLDTLHVPLAI